jgi:hypothetical protein
LILNFVVSWAATAIGRSSSPSSFPNPISNIPPNTRAFLYFLSPRKQQHHQFTIFHVTILLGVPPRSIFDNTLVLPARDSYVLHINSIDLVDILFPSFKILRPCKQKNGFLFTILETTDQFDKE